MADRIIQTIDRRVVVKTAGSELLQPLIDRKVQIAADLLALLTAEERAAAEAAASQAAAQYQDMLDIQATGDDAAAIAARAKLDGSNITAPEVFRSAIGADEAANVKLAAPVGGIEQTLQEAANALPVSVLRYGAVGDGVTDDSAAIQAAIDANKGRTIVLPQGHTFLAAGILLDGPSYDGTRLIIEGEFKFKAAPASLGSGTLNPYDYNYQFGLWGGIIFRDCEGCYIDGYIDGNRAAQPDHEHIHCVVLAATRRFEWGRLSFRELRGDGIIMVEYVLNTPGAINTNVSGAHLVGYNSSDDGRNLLSGLAVDGLTVGSIHSFQIGGVIPVIGVGDVTMPGGVDFEPDHDHQACKNITIGTVNVTTAGTAGLAIQGRPGTNVTANVRIGSAIVTNTAPPVVADGEGNLTQTFHQTLLVRAANDVTVASFRGQFTNAYGIGVIVTESDRVKVYGEVEHVNTGARIGHDTDDFAGGGVSNSTIQLDVTDIARDGFLVGKATGVTVRGRATAPVTGFYPGAKFGVRAVGALTDVNLSVSVPYNPNWIYSYRRDGTTVPTFNNTVIRDCAIEGWEPSTQMYGDMPIPRINVKGVTDQNAIPIGGANLWPSGQYVANNEPSAGEASGWVFDGTTWIVAGTVGLVQGAAVPLAAGSAPTKAEFDALVASLRSSKIIAT